MALFSRIVTSVGSSIPSFSYISSTAVRGYATKKTKGLAAPVKENSEMEEGAPLAFEECGLALPMRYFVKQASGCADIQYNWVAQEVPIVEDAADEAVPDFRFTSLQSNGGLVDPHFMYQETLELLGRNSRPVRRANKGQRPVNNKNRKKRKF
mmetsp:Transcript_29606/g.76497  ORF Transcript_29606/g.76497 Transcript_29606/m.76497 type:complete len:153 (-) Transcript_29606:133-591(-)